MNGILTQHLKGVLVEKQSFQMLLNREIKSKREFLCKQTLLFLFASHCNALIVRRIMREITPSKNIGPVMEQYDWLVLLLCQKSSYTMASKPIQTRNCNIS